MNEEYILNILAHYVSVVEREIRTYKPKKYRKNGGHKFLC